MRVSWQLSMMPSGLWERPDWISGRTVIRLKKLSVMTSEMERAESGRRMETILGTAMLSFRGEPNYDRIYDGEWKLGNVSYATIHRIAVLSTIRRHGIAGKLLGAMEEEIRGNGFSVIRMDTHRDNVPMQTWLGSHGFVHCGTIFLGRTDETRMAFEKALSLEK